ncbi:MAG: hypothetical protein SFW67_20740 [Myxococcaceae bacterium]|nr:hypothetical protein [Myxococcaceae bacterium]
MDTAPLAVLPSAILSAVRRLAPERLAGHAFDALALDVHPWHGWLNLSLHGLDAV